MLSGMELALFAILIVGLIVPFVFMFRLGSDASS